MPANLLMSILTAAEFVLWAALGFIFWKKNLHRRFPAVSSYLGLRLSSMPVLLGLYYLQAKPDGRAYYAYYFFAYWTVYIASAVTLFFVCMEIFRAMLSSFSGLMRLGTIVFRWAAIVSLLVSLATISFEHRGLLMLADFAGGLMRSVSVLELSLLAFLCLCMNAMNFTPRDTAFGFALGFGVLSSNDFVSVSLMSRYSTLTAPIQFGYEIVILGVIGSWAAYCALPEPVRKPVVLSANSTIYRWNEIAAALGHGTKIAVPQPANTLFLTDVEKVVDKVLSRSNLRGSESKY